MDYSDDEDFVLTQTPSKGYSEIVGSGYGGDVIDENNNVVSLESGYIANFEIDAKDLLKAGLSKEACDNNVAVQIEDILSDEELGKL